MHHLKKSSLQFYGNIFGEVFIEEALTPGEKYVLVTDTLDTVNFSLSLFRNKNKWWGVGLLPSNTGKITLWFVHRLGSTKELVLQLQIEAICFCLFCIFVFSAPGKIYCYCLLANMRSENFSPCPKKIIFMEMKHLSSAS